MPARCPNIRPSRFIHCRITTKDNSVHSFLCVRDLACRLISKSLTTFSPRTSPTAWQAKMPNTLELGVFKCEFKKVSLSRFHVLTITQPWLIVKLFLSLIGTFSLLRFMGTLARVPVYADSNFNLPWLVLFHSLILSHSCFKVKRKKLTLYAWQKKGPKSLSIKGLRLGGSRRAVKYW